MSQITLYLDEETREMVERSAKAQGMSKSRWVVGIIRKHAEDAWPQGCPDLAGSFPDFPLRGWPAEPSTEDTARLG